jgi:hypothetical protein
MNKKCLTISVIFPGKWCDPAKKGRVMNGFPSLHPARSLAMSCEKLHDGTTRSTRKAGGCIVPFTS